VCEDPPVSDLGGDPNPTGGPSVGGGAAAPGRDSGDAKLAAYAAAALLVAMLLVIVGGIIGALAFDIGDQVEEWKVMVKLMSLSGQGLYGFTGVGGGVLVAIGILISVFLVRNGPGAGVSRGLVSAVGSGAVAMSLWLGLLLALSIYVDLTEIDQADLAAASALGDLAGLIVLVVAGYWGIVVAGSKRISA
jgi:hypothetical protein